MVFKTNSIFNIVVLILSLIKINEALTEFQMQYNQQMIENQRTCNAQINSVFPDDDAREHAIIAIEKIYLPDRTCCNVKLDDRTFDDNGDIFEYYHSFRLHLISDNIPKIKDICRMFAMVNQELIVNPIAKFEDVTQPFERVNQRLCMHMLSRFYGLTPQESLLKVFYQQRRDMLEQFLNGFNDPESFVVVGNFLLEGLEEDNPVQIEEYVYDLKQFPDIAYYYWETILIYFRVETGNNSNIGNDGNSGNDGVLSKVAFCATRHRLILED